MKYSSQQQKAIDSLGKNVLVSASAGAGKTAVLIARMMKRITQDHVSLDRLLAMTFTEAAASEMKKRLSKELHALLATSSDKPYLEKQISYLQDAKISTIHGFCLDVIKKYYFVIGLDPQCATNVLEEGVVNQAFTEAFNEALEESLSKTPEETLRLLEYFSMRSESLDECKEGVHQLMKAAESSFDSTQYYAKCLENYPVYTRLTSLPEDIQENFLLYFKLHLQQALELLEECTSYNDVQLKDKDLREFLTESTKYLQDALDDSDPTYTNLLHTLGSTKRPFLLPNNKDEVYKKQFRDPLYEIGKKIYNIAFEENQFAKNSSKDAAIAQALVSLTQATAQHFSAKKRALQGLDFDDMETLCYKILQEPNGHVAEKIRDSLEEIMVDEFQDTNEMQNAIVELISKGNNVFRVGDVKQSIYRFRKAKPSIMKGLMLDTENTEVLYLTENYRSKQNIVDFTNLLFGKSMNVEGVANDYSCLDIVSVGQASQKEILPQSIAFLEIPSVEKKEEDEESLDNKTKKASAIARKIIELRSSSSHKNWKEYTVLVRSHADKIELQRAFDAYGIPSYMDAKEGFYQSYACSLCLSVLRVIEDPNDLFSLLSLATSSLFKIDENQLAQIKIDQKKFTADLLYQAIPSFKEQLEAWKSCYQTQGLTALLNNLVRTQDFYNEGLSIQEKTNFDLFYEKAITFEEQGTSLSDFLKALDANAEEKSSEAVSIAPDEDVVRVVTIHQSKGLQYPVVFLWSSSESRFLDKQEPLIIDDQLGFGIQSYRDPYQLKFPNPTRLALEYKQSQEDLAEQVRLLYVAVTRAVDSLYLVDVVKHEPSETLTLGRLNKRHGLTDVVLSSLNKTEIKREVMVSEPLPEEAKKSVSAKQVLPCLPQKEDTLESFTKPRLRGLSINDIDAMRHGTYVHRCYEELPTRPWVESDLAPYNQLTQEDKQALLAFGNSEIYGHCCSMNVIKEYPFLIQDGEEIISQIYDFLALNEKEVIIIDYKTNPISLADLEKIKDYQEQLGNYIRYARILFPNRKIAAYIWSTHNQAFIDMTPYETKAAE